MPEKILIVDDDPDSLKLIGLMLQRHGYQVHAANTGNQALAKATSEHPDLIILDVMMPDMNGYEVCRRLRSNPETQPIPIIMFTAKTLIDDKVAGFEAGADDYLTKPTHPAELASRVKSILQRSAGKRPKEVGKGLALGVIGAKGGVGVSTMTLNLGAAFKQMGENPIIADFRLGAGSLGLFMGVERSTGMANVLARPPAEIRPNVIEKELVSHETGLRALLSSARPREAQLTFPIDSATAIVKALRTMGKPAIFDLGSEYTPLVSRVQAEMDKVVLVVEPNGAAVAMARELIQELEAENKGRIHLIIFNHSHSSTQTAWHDVETALGHEIRAIISAASDLAFQAEEAGTPIVNLQPNAIVTSQIMKLAEDMNATIKTLAGGEITP